MSSYSARSAVHWPYARTHQRDRSPRTLGNAWRRDSKKDRRASRMTDANEIRSRLGNLLRWAPSIILGSTILKCWTVVGVGDWPARDGAWSTLMTVGALAVVPLFCTIVYAFRRGARAPVMALIGVLIIGAWPMGWQLGILPIAFPARIESTRPSATVRLPTDVPLNVVWGGDRVAVNPHVWDSGQRWAYDLVVEPYLSDSKNLEDYGCWDVPVVAPASGRIVDAEDGIRDETPGARNLSQPSGNHVILQLPKSGTYLVIAHLKQGSVAVRQGDEVVEGQEIGRCGNSGNSAEPHIHIHHQRERRRSEGLPLFFRDHDGPPMPEGGIEKIDGRSRTKGPAIQHGAIETDLDFTSRSRENPAEIVAQLEAGAGTEMRDGRGRTPLHFAAWFNGDPDSVTAILEFGADPNSPDKLDGTPLHYAAEYNENAAISRSLMEAGRDLHVLDEFGRTLLNLAARNNRNPAIVNELLDAGLDSEARDSFGRTPLHLAAWNKSNPAVLAQLLETRASVGVRNQFEGTPLHFAAWHNKNPTVISMLVDAEAGPEAQDNFGRTPVHRAARRSTNPEVIAALLDVGEAVRARDHGGETPWNRARERDELEGSGVFSRLQQAIH